MQLDSALLTRLAPWGFDSSQLDAFAARCSQPASSNAVKGTLTPPAKEDVRALPEKGTPEHARLSALGRAALDRNEVGVIILAGGMATRFGGVVKAVVPVIEGRTFLQLKLDDVRKVSATAPVYVMSSFTTHERLEQHVRELGATHTFVFPQFVSVRLTPKGELFKEPSDGDVSPYATGHGDLTFAFRRSGLLANFRAAGGKLLMMSNVDNLGASLDPCVIGAHLDKPGVALSAEVVRKAKGDKGGAPARLDGVPQIIEGFRFPESFDQDSIPVFNTNTFVMDAAAIDRDFALPFYRVEKKVEGATAIQFERLVGELTAFLPSTFLEVPREGAPSRFLPAKDPEELASRLETIRLAVNR
ncbi:MAG: UTP--glucose-1-phosphate uridylyltransferase [Archangium sp.]|nr:UTP--glucose-1-phosphate uridylyltransferase [Archangium sp.]